MYAKNTGFDFMQSTGCLVFADWKHKGSSDKSEGKGAKEGKTCNV